MTPHSVIIACDPGVQGALAVLVDGQLAEIEDMPTMTVRIGGKDRRMVSGDILDGIMVSLVKSYVGLADRVLFVLEEVGPRPKESTVATFAFGRGYGMVEQQAIAQRLPRMRVQPAVWKRQLKLKSGKDASRQRAMEQFPDFREEFARAKDDGRAEAALIGQWAHLFGG